MNLDLTWLNSVLAADKATIARFAHHKFGVGCNVGSLQDLPESEREMVRERIMAKLETKIENDKKTHNKNKKRAAAEMGDGVGDGCTGGSDGVGRALMTTQASMTYHIPIASGGAFTCADQAAPQAAPQALRPPEPPRSTAGVAMALKVDERTGTINVRKIKSATAKPAMVTFVNTHPEDLDFCLKLLAQHHTPRDSGDGDARATWRLAEPLRWDSVRQLVWPKRADKRLAPRITRVKHKVVFEGQHGGYTMRVTITGVKDAFGHHTQVGGTCVELQQLLKDTEAGATAVVVEAALGPAVKALVSVLDVLANG
ncbi:hypothetical protein FOA52_015884 [Chlamydomonas sp. UWO 241]|nr:hypothetical protein FOA52_015884 [Chlamydomonas sp. UWO 241]